jgi:MFS family permease
MHLIQRVRRFAALAGLAAGLVAFGAAPAFAKVMPPAGGDPDVVPQHLVPVHAVVTSGMPGWQITLIAVGAALLAAVAAVLADRARAARRHVIATAA